MRTGLPRIAFDFRLEADRFGVLAGLCSEAVLLVGGSRYLVKLSPKLLQLGLLLLTHVEREFLTLLQFTSHRLQFHAIVLIVFILRSNVEELA